MRVFLAVCVLYGVCLHCVMCSLRCDTRASTLEENRILFCEAKSFGGVALLGQPTTNPIDTGLPNDGWRLDEFLISQVFKGDEGLSPADTIRVKYHYDTASRCDRYPYDRSGMEVVIYGFYDQGMVEIPDCQHVKVYDCIKNKETLSAWVTSSPCIQGGGTVFKANES